MENREVNKLMREIKVGVVGLGRQALRHISTLVGFDDVKISAVCDINEGILKKIGHRYRISSLYKDYVKMAEKSAVDCVFVVTKPDETHSKITEIFLENGKHVFCEKPMATKLSEMENVVKKAKDYDGILMVGFNRRYMPIFQKAKEEFMNPSQVEVCKAEMCAEKTILRGLNSNYVHMIDVLRWFCGEPVRVEAQARYKDPNYEETIVALITFDMGALGVHISNSNSGGYVERVTIYGNKKTLMVDVPSLTVKNLKGGAYQPAVVTNFVTDSWREFSYKFGFEQEDRHFINCVKTGENPLTSGEDALKSHQLVNTIYAKCGLPTLN